MTKKILQSLLVLIFALPFTALAHEVYVLPHKTIQPDFSSPSPNPFTALNRAGDLKNFLVYGGLYLLVILVVMALSGNHRLTGTLGVRLQKLKKYGPLVARLTLGLSLFSAGLHQSLFGPELPLNLFGNAQILSLLLMTMGALAFFGLFSRLTALAVLIIYLYSVFFQGAYMLTYINYPAEALLILMGGGGLWSLDALAFKNPDAAGRMAKLMAIEKKYGGLILRLGLGLALLWTAISIKFIHSDLPLDVINGYHLTKFFPFDPLFIVLGAGLVETTISLFYILGFEIRFNTLFFLSFITLSILYFGEAVWPHIMLYGLALAIFCQGYDQYTFEMSVLKRTKEPIL